VYQVSNSVTFSGKTVGFEGLLNQMVEPLGIIIDKPRKNFLTKWLSLWVLL